MKIKPLYVYALILASCLFLPSLVNARGFGADAGPLREPPPPVIMYPIYETADITGKEFLEFRWRPEFGAIGRYEFRLYKGYDRVADNLMTKQTLEATETSYNVASDQFINGQIYTWSLISISYSGVKSEKSFNSFKIIKN